MAIGGGAVRLKPCEVRGEGYDSCKSQDVRNQSYRILGHVRYITREYGLVIWVSVRVRVDVSVSASVRSHGPIDVERTIRRGAWSEKSE